ANECAVKFFRRDANDRVLNAVHVLRLADDFRIIFVTILPGQVTDYRDRVRVVAGPFFRSEAAAKHRLHAKRIEVVRGNKSTGRAFRPITDTQRCAHDPINDERLEKCGIFLRSEERRVGKEGSYGMSRDDYT